MIDECLSLVQLLSHLDSVSASIKGLELDLGVFVFVWWCATSSLVSVADDGGEAASTATAVRSQLAYNSNPASGIGVSSHE